MAKDGKDRHGLKMTMLKIICKPWRQPETRTLRMFDTFYQRMVNVKCKSFSRDSLEIGN